MKLTKRQYIGITVLVALALLNITFYEMWIMTTIPANEIPDFEPYFYRMILLVSIDVPFLMAGVIFTQNKKFFPEPKVSTK